VTPSEAFDILLAIYIEYGHPPSLKDMQRFRAEHLPDSPHYRHPIKATAPEQTEVE
jgi:hypothetical protein